MREEMLRGAGIPSAARRARGPVACIECFQQIPCNPCEEACPQGAITVGREITGLPRLDEDKCTGCGICMTRCPGLAIFCMDESHSEMMAQVSFPYEYVPLPREGQRVRCTDRNGSYVTDGTVYRVRTSRTFDHTAIVTVEIPREYSMKVRFLDRQTVPEKNDNDIYVCRCEEVTLGDIKRAIAAGANSVRAVKLRTHAGMGVCQGMTCTKNIERILKESGVDVDARRGRSQRFPVRLLNAGDMAELLGEQKEAGE